MKMEAFYVRPFKKNAISINEQIRDRRLRTDNALFDESVKIASECCDWAHPALVDKE